MKYKIETYDDYLNLSLADENKISDDDFDLYTDNEISLLNNFNLQFQKELSNVKQKHTVKQLSQDQFYNLSHKEILKIYEK